MLSRRYRFAVGYSLPTYSAFGGKWSHGKFKINPENNAFSNLQLVVEVWLHVQLQAVKVSGWIKEQGLEPASLEGSSPPPCPPSNGSHRLAPPTPTR